MKLRVRLRLYLHRRDLAPLLVTHVERRNDGGPGGGPTEVLHLVDSSTGSGVGTVVLPPGGHEALPPVELEVELGDAELEEALRGAIPEVEHSRSVGYVARVPR